VQRKAYVPGIAALLAALLAGCTGGSGSKGTAADPKPGDISVNTPAAQPGKYRTLPEACAAVSHDSLDSLLPGIREITDQDRRDTAYEGQATLTYDTDRRVGCGWKVESTDATDHLSVDFERVVSYDNAVSDDSRAQDIYATEETAADLPEASASATPSGSGSATATPSATPSTSASSSASASSTSSASASASTSAGPSDDPRRPPAPASSAVWATRRSSTTNSTPAHRRRSSAP
jgi:hypothetical protein